MHSTLHKVFRSSRALAAAAGLCVGLSAASAFEGTGASIGSPVYALGAPAKGMVAVGLDIRNYAALKFSGPTQLTGFPLADQGMLDLDVVRFDPFGSDAVLVVAGDGPERPLPRPEIVLLRGQVHNRPGSTVFLGLSPTAMNGYITLDGRKYVLSSGPAGSGVPAVVYDVGGIPAGLVKIVNHPCGTDALPVPPHEDVRPAPRGGGSTDATCKAVRMAIETDFEYTNGVFGGNATNSAAYATTLLAAISEIYKRDFNVALEVSYLRIWTTNTDPYTSTTVEGRLDELKNYWNANMSSVGRNLTHILTGVAAGAGGVAYLGVVCPGGYSYGSSGHLGGYFPYPLVNNNGQNWDLMVVAHEVGHNFNAPHTHDMTPPVDGCGASPQNCANANQGTIMSYCHGCSGGMNNIVLAFHPRTINETVLPYLNGSTAPCLQIRQPLGFLSQPAAQNTPLTGAASFSVAMGVGGGPMSFRWNKGGVDLSDDAHITGSHTDTLVISPVGNGDAGNYRVKVTNACGTVTSGVGKLSLTCYSNCDGSSTLPMLTANDFQCFLNSFAMGAPYANCDDSTTVPVLTANDFQCFLNAFAAGCS